MGTSGTIRSMTGYGRAAADLPQARVVVEVRTVNHRYADVRVRIPTDLAPHERDFRHRVRERVARGRVELSINIEAPEGKEARPRLNRPLLEEALAAARSLAAEDGIEGGISADSVLAIPGMFKTTAPELEWTPDEVAFVQGTLDAALDALDADRLREGSHLRNEMALRLEAMVGIAEDLRERAAAVPVALRERVLERLRELAPGIDLDPGRMAQEAAVLADRCDVTEELVRLDGHLAQARSLLDRGDGKPVGRRLDFLLQEIGRETNTVNSKASDLKLATRALDMKVELEKVREQAQNVE